MLLGNTSPVTLQLFTSAFPNEQARIIKTLVEIDPTHSSKYQAIIKSEGGGR